MAKVNINGTDYELKDGMNLVDAAESVGIDIPHYCYHPGLSIAGQCRMCYVEINDGPKLGIACNTHCTDGLKVVTNSKKVKDAVKWSLEFHLINHPIDCPICDQAGECGLQDYYMKHGKYESDMREHKVNKEKAVDLGDKIVLDKERCILCGRCVRFTQEVSKTAALGIYNRGDRSVVGTINDQPMTDNYQVNTVDICPVGALTSKDFRFEQRVWLLDEAESVCGGCSKGCNVYVHHKKQKHIYRLKPRYNEQVNSYWMCDVGRETYKTSNYDKRVTDAKLGGVELPLLEAIQTWAADLRTLLAMEQSDEVAVWLSPHHTNEELESIFDLFKNDFGISKFYSEDIEAIVNLDTSADDFLFRTDRYPNSAGFLKITKERKIKTAQTEQLVEHLKSGKIKHLVVFAPEMERSNQMMAFIQSAIQPDVFVSLLTAQQDAVKIFSTALSLPVLSHLEKTGSMINHQNISQQLTGGFKMFKDTASIQEVCESLKKEYSQPSTARRAEGGQS